MHSPRSRPLSVGRALGQMIVPSLTLAAPKEITTSVSLYIRGCRRPSLVTCKDEPLKETLDICYYTALATDTLHVFRRRSTQSSTYTFPRPSGLLISQPLMCRGTLIRCLCRGSPPRFSSVSLRKAGDWFLWSVRADSTVASQQEAIATQGPVSARYNEAACGLAGCACANL